MQAARPRSLRSNSAVAQPDSAATRRAAAPEKMALRQRKGLASSLARSKPGADDEGPPRGGEGRDALVLAALLVCFVGLPVLTLHGGGEIPNWVLQLIASSLAVLIAEISTLPFDVAKVRLQCDSKRFAGVFDALRGTAAEDGVVALWKGVVPACIRILYHAVAVVFCELQRPACLLVGR